MNNVFDTTNRLVTVCMLKFKIASQYHYSHLIIYTDLHLRKYSTNTYEICIPCTVQTISKKKL